MNGFTSIFSVQELQRRVIDVDLVSPIVKLFGTQYFDLEVRERLATSD
jgi:hypothetical protein